MKYKEKKYEEKNKLDSSILDKIFCAKTNLTGVYIWQVFRNRLLKNALRKLIDKVLKS